MWMTCVMFWMVVGWLVVVQAVTSSVTTGRADEAQAVVRAAGTTPAPMGQSAAPTTTSTTSTSSTSTTLPPTPQCPPTHCPIINPNPPSVVSGHEEARRRVGHDHWADSNDPVVEMLASDDSEMRDVLAKSIAWYEDHKDDDEYGDVDMNGGTFVDSVGAPATTKPDWVMGCSSTGAIVNNKTTGHPRVYCGPPRPEKLAACKVYKEASCCTAAQSVYLGENLGSLALLFDSCYACYHNLVSMVCGLTCNPYQARYIENIEFQYHWTNVTDRKGFCSVEKARYSMHPDLAQAVYDSCKSMPLEGGYIWGHLYPTPLKFLNALGALGSEKFEFKLDPVLGLNFPRCKKGHDDEENCTLLCEDYCQCETCKKACPKPLNFHLKVVPCEWQLTSAWRVPCLLFSFVGAGLAALLFALMSVVFIKFGRCDSKSDDDDEVYAALLDNDDSLSFLSESQDDYAHTQQALLGDIQRADVGRGGGLNHMTRGTGSPSPRLNRGHDNLTWAQRYWRAHGMFVGRHPWITVFLGVAICGALSAFVTRLEVESNPEKLWVGPRSRSALNEKAFNKEFGAFYRVNQIIATVVKQDLPKNSSGGDSVTMALAAHAPKPAPAPKPTSNTTTTTTTAAATTTKAPPPPPHHPAGYRPPIFNPTKNLKEQYEWMEELLQVQLDIMQKAAVLDDEGTSDATTTRDDNNINNNNNDDDATVTAVAVAAKKNHVVLDDLCFKPVKGKGCIINSVFGFYQASAENFKSRSCPPEVCKQSNGTVYSWLDACTSNSLELHCRDAIGAPVQSDVVLGGFDLEKGDVMNATALVFTFLLNNEPKTQSKARAWEKDVFLKVVEDYMKLKPGSERHFHLSFMAQRSTQDELSKEATANAPVVAASYLAMFLYVSIALGKLWPLDSGVFARTKFTLGLAGVCCVLLSLSASVGIGALVGIKASMILVEVIPFLVLAIGVDNVFMLVNHFDTLDRSVDISERIAATLMHAGTSIALASISETVAFLLGIVTGMPAVVSFAMYAAMAIFIDFLLQVTVFAALVALDARRREEDRVECVPCLKTPSQYTDDRYGGLLKRLISNFYVPVLLNKFVRPFVLCVFFVMLLLGINYGVQVELGLEQQVALPRTSYLQSYFSDLAAYLRVGPPVYLVIKPPYNYSDKAELKKLCALGGCDPRSVVNMYDASPTFVGTSLSWLDDYLSWAKAPACCMVESDSVGMRDVMMSRNSAASAAAAAAAVSLAPMHVNETQRRLDWWQYQGDDDQDGLDDDYDDEWMAGAAPKQCWALSGETCDPKKENCCVRCFGDLSKSATFPSKKNFHAYLPWFLRGAPANETAYSKKCRLTGLAYNGDVQFHNETRRQKIKVTRIRTYHTVMKDQQDYINAVNVAYQLADYLNKHLHLEMYPFSVFYVFFEQYLEMHSIALVALGMALGGMLITTVISLRNVTVSLLLVSTVAMIVVDLLGIMYWWQIRLNAISVVNLVMCIGISVEFCSHIAFAFLRAKGSSRARAATAMREVGASVVSGIALTKLIGVVVLGFAPSELFVKYYYHQFLGILIFAAANGLVFLPVALSLLPKWATSSCGK